MLAFQRPFMLKNTFMAKTNLITVQLCPLPPPLRRRVLRSNLPYHAFFQRLDSVQQLSLSSAVSNSLRASSPLSSFRPLFPLVVSRTAHCSEYIHGRVEFDHRATFANYLYLYAVVSFVVICLTIRLFTD